MVSVSKPQSSGQAGQYFSKEDYYTQSQGEWFGKAVEAFGLDQGSLIDKEDFQKIAEGKDLEGNQIIGTGGKEQTHRAGTDMTFSAPKSVSILALTDERVVQAHDMAVKAALTFYDENFAQVRETVNGETRHVESQGSAWGLFGHQTSRELDAQLHTHAFKLNASLDSNGQLRADANENMYRQQMFMGAIYHSELAKNLNNLEYKTTDIDRRTGTFEIEGINKDLMKDMSSRREQVLERAAELKEQFPNLSEAKLNEMAALDSRQAKQTDISKEFLENKWEQMAVDRGTTMMGEKENAREAGLTREKTVLSATDTVKLAANSLLQNESTFTQKDLLSTAAKLSIGTHGISDLNKAIGQLYKSHELVNLEKGGMDSVVTTPDMQATEKGIMKHIQENASTQQAFYTPDIAKQVVNEKYTTLSENQKEFVAGCLSSNAQVILAQGYSGSGKTFAASELVKEVKEFGFEVRAFGPTAAAARELGNSTGVQGETLAKFFMSDASANGHVKGKELWLVDEASMISSKDMMQLMTRAADAEARVVLIGDKNQLQSVAAGRMFGDLQKMGITDKLELTDIKRQKTEHMINAAGKIRDIEQVKDALQIIENKGNLHEVKDFAERVDKISDQYVNSDPETTMLVVSTNKERHELNKAIHEKLQSEGKIGSENYTITMKESKSLDAVQKHFADGYQVGDLIQSSKSGGGLPSGYSGRVTGVDTETNTLTLTDAKGNEKVFDPMQHGDNVSVSRERDITVSEGDKIVFLKNDNGDKGIGVVNGDSGKITSINENGYMTVQTEKGEIAFNVAQYNNIDLGHAITSYKSQGASVDNVIVSGDPRQENYNNFYVALTRGKEDATVYTNDHEALKEAISIEQSKTSTLDYDKEVTELKANFESENMKMPEVDYAKETAEMNQHIDGATPELANHEHTDHDKEVAEMREHLSDEAGAVAVTQSQLDREDEHDKEKDHEQEKERDLGM